MLDRHDRRRQSLLERVRAAQTIWAEAGAEDGVVASDLARLEDRLVDGHAAVGVFGLMKRGKSTVLNALLGQTVSPMRAVPETAVPVVVEHGDELSIEAVLADGGSQPVPLDDIRRWCSQEHNSGNHRGVAFLRWRLPSALLQHGVRLIDTPGLDDADEVYTQRTLQQMRDVDAGIVVVSAPPTVGATEINYLRALRHHHAERLVVVCNVHEQHADDPSVVTAVTDYVRSHTSAVGADVRVIPMCATRALEAAISSDERGWVASGGAAVLDAIESVVDVVAGSRLIDVSERALREMVDMAQGQLTAWTSDDTRPTEPTEPTTARSMEQLITQVDVALLQAHYAVNQLFEERRARIGALLQHVDPAREVARFAVEVDLRVTDVLAAVRDRVSHAAEAAAGALGQQSSGEGLETSGPIGPAGSVHGRSRRSAALAGLAGTVGLAAAGLALGPLGLVGGALVGWRVGDLAVATASGSRRQALRELDTIRDAVLADLDHRAELITAELRVMVETRLDAIARDNERRLHDHATAHRIMAELDGVVRDPNARSLVGASVPGVVGGKEWGGSQGRAVGEPDHHAAGSAPPDVAPGPAAAHRLLRPG